MSLLTVGVFGTSRKKQEKRVPIHPDQLDWIDEKIKSNLIFEEGYGVPFGMDDTQLAAMSGGVLSRADLFQQCDIALLAKNSRLLPGRLSIVGHLTEIGKCISFKIIMKSPDMRGYTMQ